MKITKTFLWAPAINLSGTLIGALVHKIVLTKWALVLFPVSVLLPLLAFRSIRTVPARLFCHITGYFSGTISSHHARLTTASWIIWGIVFLALTGLSSLVGASLVENWLYATGDYGEPPSNRFIRVQTTYSARRNYNYETVVEFGVRDYAISGVRARIELGPRINDVVADHCSFTASSDFPLELGPNAKVGCTSDAGADWSVDCATLTISPARSYYVRFRSNAPLFLSNATFSSLNESVDSSFVQNEGTLDMYLRTASITILAEESAQAVCARIDKLGDDILAFLIRSDTLSRPEFPAQGSDSAAFLAYGRARQQYDSLHTLLQIDRGREAERLFSGRILEAKYRLEERGITNPYIASLLSQR